MIQLEREEADKDMSQQKHDFEKIKKKHEGKLLVIKNRL
jgi:hypothetical protein